MHVASASLHVFRAAPPSRLPPPRLLTSRTAERVWCTPRSMRSTSRTTTGFMPSRLRLFMPSRLRLPRAVAWRARARSAEYQASLSTPTGHRPKGRDGAGFKSRRRTPHPVPSLLFPSSVLSYSEYSTSTCRTLLGVAGCTAVHCCVLLCVLQQCSGCSCLN